LQPMVEHRYPTIKALVLDFIHKCQGRVDHRKLEGAVLGQFPDSAWKMSHWSWYRSQCTRGRFADKFSAVEKANLETTRRRHAELTSEGPQRNGKSHGELEARPITDSILSAAQMVIDAALRYEAATGGTRKAGVTGEVGEILACDALHLKLVTGPGSEGFDAVDAEGKHVQIKTRRSESEGLPRDAGRLGTFSRHAFDYALLVLLDHGYRLAEIWRAEYAALKPLVDSQKRRNPNLASFKRISKKVWPIRSRTCGDERPEPTPESG